MLSLSLGAVVALMLSLDLVNAAPVEQGMAIYILQCIV